LADAGLIVLEQLKVIERRNKIAHEADLDPSYPGQKWPIDRAQVDYACDLLEKLARAIFKVTL
jgi:hypothetical protein